MKSLIAIASLLYVSIAAADPSGAAADTAHRYMIERTFPKGALEGLDADTKAQVNANNAKLDVRWIKSFTNAEKTKTYCVYEAPSEAAVRKAAKVNALPVDSVMEIPFDIESESDRQQTQTAAAK